MAWKQKFCEVGVVYTSVGHVNCTHLSLNTVLHKAFNFLFEDTSSNKQDSCNNKI